MDYLTTKITKDDIVAIMLYASRINVLTDFTGDRDQLTGIIKSLPIGEMSEMADLADDGYLAPRAIASHHQVEIADRPIDQVAATMPVAGKGEGGEGRVDARCGRLGEIQFHAGARQQNLPLEAGEAEGSTEGFERRRRLDWRGRFLGDRLTPRRIRRGGSFRASDKLLQ